MADSYHDHFDQHPPVSCNTAAPPGLCCARRLAAPSRARLAHCLGCRHSHRTDGGNCAPTSCLVKPMSGRAEGGARLLPSRHCLDLGRQPGIGKAVTPSGIAPRLAALVETVKSVNGFEAVGGNSLELLENSNIAIERLVDEIDQARESVHVCFYIWLTDNNGLKMVDALKRAAARGVTCRVIADSLGSRHFITSPEWREMQQAGVKTVASLRIGNPLVHLLSGRLDLRNHRKIVVIDNCITYCGSQNCADPGIPRQGALRAMGRRDAAAGGPGGTPEPVPFRHPLDGVGAGKSVAAASCAIAARCWKRHCASVGHRPDGAAFGHARDIRLRHLCGRTRADRHHALLCSR